MNESNVFVRIFIAVILSVLAYVVIGAVVTLLTFLTPVQVNAITVIAEVTVIAVAVYYVFRGRVF